MILLKHIYWGGKKITCKVIGILRAGYHIEGTLKNIFNNLIHEESLDNYIIIPDYLIESSDDSNKYFDKIRYSQKCEGIILIDSLEDLQYKIGLIKNLSEEIGFNYSISDIYTALYKEINMKLYQVILMLIIGIIVFVLFFILIIREYKIVISRNDDRESKKMLRFDAILDYILIIIVSYGISYFLFSAILPQKAHSQFIYAGICCSIISLILMVIVIVIICITKCFDKK